MNNFIYLVIGIIFLIILLQLIFRFKGWSRKGKPAPRVGGKLGKSIARGDKLVAYFYGPTCNACRTMERNLPKIEEKFDNIVRINTAVEREIATAFGIMGIPTTIVIEQGIIKDYFIGITPPNRILKSLGY